MDKKGKMMIIEAIGLTKKPLPGARFDIIKINPKVREGMEKLTIELTREEAEALMDCIAIVDRSKRAGILIITKVAEFRLKQVSLNDLWIKIFGAHEKKFMQIPQGIEEKSAGS